jgi:hypothetical protein
MIEEMFYVYIVSGLPDGTVSKSFSNKEARH